MRSNFLKEARGLRGPRQNITTEVQGIKEKFGIINPNYLPDPDG
jgi:hypothetical protein